MTVNGPTENLRAWPADDRTVIDAYPVAAGSSGGPPDWHPPVAQPVPPARPGAPRAAKGKLAVAGAIAAAVVATAGVTAAVVGSRDDSSAAAGNTAAGGSPGGQALPDDAGRGQFGRGGGGGPGMAALHGTSVVPDGNGGYVTQETQTGTVSAVSSTSITVKSEDGYSRTYVVGGSTSVDNGADQIADVQSGHTVRVVATTSGETATATTVIDSSLASAQQQDGGGMRPGGPGDGGAGQGTQGGAATGT
ncbi:hypothetical protein COUCH_36625 [Couchioplanes caeruleus]|uniref:hypothetical protein n=1 Tax=Couchioplanes caeruleus TaxID=56438 RepID=UPI0020BDDAFD|nr:hypothetical protein [Couchioplanes caeruleus]UQU64422.1 hypothetical protein COUCH_36625 [Couchioplanes caeruleus]